MQPAVLTGVTNNEDKNGGAYSNTKRFVISSTVIVQFRSWLEAPQAWEQLTKNDHEINRRISRLPEQVSAICLAVPQSNSRAISKSAARHADRSTTRQRSLLRSAQKIDLYWPISRPVTSWGNKHTFDYNRGNPATNLPLITASSYIWTQAHQ